jgi:hypothetical protein
MYFGLDINVVSSSVPVIRSAMIDALQLSLLKHNFVVASLAECICSFPELTTRQQDHFEWLYEVTRLLVSFTLSVRLFLPSFSQSLFFPVCAHLSETALVVSRPKVVNDAIFLGLRLFEWLNDYLLDDSSGELWRSPSAVIEPVQLPVLSVSSSHPNCELALFNVCWQMSNICLVFSCTARACALEEPPWVGQSVRCA